VHIGEPCFTLPGRSGHKIIVQFSNGELLTFAVPLKKHALEWLEAFRKTKMSSSYGGDGNSIEKWGLLFFLDCGSSWIYSRWEGWTYRSVCLQTNGKLVLRTLTRLGHFPLRQVRLESTCVTQPIFHLVASDKILTLRCDSVDTCERWKRSISQISEHCSPGTHVNTVDGAVVEFYNTLHDVMSAAHTAKNYPRQQQAENDTFFILSIDGGGTRGIIPCILLERIIGEFPDFLSRVDMVAGTR
jgi:hypothetical protein